LTLIAAERPVLLTLLASASEEPPGFNIFGVTFASAAKQLKSRKAFGLK
jgi:hypothetical protein